MGSALVKDPIIYERRTNNLVEEKVPIKLKTALQFLFGTMLGRCIVLTPHFRSYLKRVTLEKGWRYDAKESKAEIAEFISGYGIDTNDMEKPLDEYETLNEFFYRRLKAEARPIAAKDDPAVLVSPCDCRIHVFPTVTEAKTIWVKGKRFNIRNLTGSERAASVFENGSVVICRLAPTDYHRFHSPVQGVVGDDPFAWLGQEYYTVKKLAICTPLNVLTENKRLYFSIRTEVFGEVGVVIVGAAHVASIKMSKREGEEVKKGEELGYFAYGGSTVVLLFKEGAVQYDDDLLSNSKGGAETLIKMGDSLGKRAGSGPLFAAPPRDSSTPPSVCLHLFVHVA
eukprot:CAMPEP_0113881806 /NCGR_PEP_ID=MMETSP0780_2-20120614/8586_1 /TAXON_ID=652834 /ORGANISM="Palpitomonas bilix" /LENGTH=339 /DNA_ID=CAMNT_0000868715 /DNA_START=283 /DNA_END=1299 /DNA_ORIENTATION=- /assembly_acc=CAM_ASM_000599